MTTIPPALEPCPFCGGPATEIAGLIGCEPCAIGRRNAASWNRRAFGTEAAGEVVRLRVSVERACEAIENLHLGFRDAALRVRAALSPHAKEESNG